MQEKRKKKTENVKSKSLSPPKPWSLTKRKHEMIEDKMEIARGKQRMKREADSRKKMLGSELDLNERIPDSSQNFFSNPVRSSEFV